MTNIIFRFLMLSLVTIGLAGCGPLFRLDLTVVGERTALERQVLGTYQELGRDLSVYTSVRAVQPDGSMAAPPPATESQRQVLQAMNNRRYNRDDLNILLQAGVVGEGRDGMLHRRQDTAALPAGFSSELYEEVFAEENRDRGIIIERLMRTTPGVQPGQHEEVAWVFARLNQDTAPEGAPIQDRAGEWRTK